jgi:restriction system protein
MRPLLVYLADGQERGSQETFEALANEFALTPEERAQLLPSGKQPVFVNRVAWAKSHLKGAGVLESPRRGVYKITPRGRTLLTSHAGPIGMKTLAQFPEYVEFRTPSNDSKQPILDVVQPQIESSLTPEELIEYGYDRIRAQLAQELLAKVKASPPEFFEHLVVELLVSMGYGGSRADAGRAVGRGGDGGIDGIIKEDKLGLDTIYIQAKRWEGSVGRPEIQKFAGALQGVRARKGIFITTSSFTADAQSYAGNIDNRIVLIDGQTLANLMIDYDVGVTRAQSYDIKRLDSDYFLVDE